MLSKKTADLDRIIGGVTLLGQTGNRRRCVGFVVVAQAALSTGTGSIWLITIRTLDRPWRDMVLSPIPIRFQTSTIHRQAHRRHLMPANSL